MGSPANPLGMKFQELNPVRWGLLAASSIATRAFVPAAEKSEYAVTHAVASRDPAKAEACASMHGLTRAHGSYDALLRDDDIEAVYVSLPNSLHVDWVIKALEAGKHVLCEKPMHRDPRQVARAFDAAERADRLLMEAFMYRHHPDTHQLMRCIASGELGDVHHVRAALSFTMPGSVNVRLVPELHGGALMDVGCYAVNALRMLCGEPDSVSGLEHIGPSGVDLRFAGFLQSQTGVSGFFDCGLDLPSRSCIEIIGTKGTVRADWPFFRPFFPHLDPPMIEVRVGLNSRRLPLSDDNPYVAQIDNFSRAIRGIGRPLLGRGDALAQSTVIDALRRSAAAQSQWISTRAAE
jgi:xylose dehydrogenase (NAD/NADP)